MKRAFLICSVLTIATIDANAQTPPPPTSITTGVGLLVNGAVFTTPLSIYLLTEQPSGGIIPGVVVGAIGITSIVAGLVQLTVGVQQRNAITIRGDGFTVRF